MKKITTLLFLSIAFQSFAIDRFVDPNLTSSNGTTLFTNITSAITAAVNGDRIIVSSGTYNEAALTIGKSLQIMPQTPGTTINFNANITIAGFPGMKFEITGFNIGVYSFGSTFTGDITNKAKISIINCNSTNLDFNQSGIELYSISNTIVNQVTFKNGSIVLNTVGTIYIADSAANSPLTEDKNLVVANTINSLLYVFNNDNKLIIANNNISGAFLLKRWNANSSIRNRIFNNNFNNIKLLVSAGGVPNYNLIFTNNTGAINFYNNLNNSTPFDDQHLDYNSQGAEDIILNNNYYYPMCGCPLNSPSSSEIRFPNNDISGIFEWSYNGIAHPQTPPSGSQPLSFTNILGTTKIVYAGNQNHDYYDIDLTINDRGINGGPFSQLNYNAANPNNSKAFIFDLDMPADLFPGQNVEIKAKGYHKN
jgi:hypothetical protein